MPRPRRSNLSRRSRNAIRKRNIAKEWTDEEQEIAREKDRISMARLRASRSQEQTEADRETARLAMRIRRTNNRDRLLDHFRHPKLCNGTLLVNQELIDPDDNPESNSVQSAVPNPIQMPVISKIESLCCKDSMSTYPQCPECKETQSSMKMHFVGNNLPLNEDFKCPVCKYVASTQCSFSAHLRIHANITPFICPECGKKFESREYLMNHLDEVCFHLAKQVRIRCPGKRCGKLFASPATFTAHFAQHIHTWFQCSVCKECFDNVTAYSDHTEIHKYLCFSDKVFKCLSCKNEDSIIYQDNLDQHIQYHISDRSRCMYVFICKFCRNYFKSTLTYATHSLRCQKCKE